METYGIAWVGRAKEVEFAVFLGSARCLSALPSLGGRKVLWMRKWRAGHFNQDLKPPFCSDSKKGAWKIRYDFLPTAAPTLGWESNMSIFRAIHNSDVS